MSEKEDRARIDTKELIKKLRSLTVPRERIKIVFQTGQELIDPMIKCHNHLSKLLLSGPDMSFNLAILDSLPKELIVEIFEKEKDFLHRFLKVMGRIGYPEAQILMSALELIVNNISNIDENGNDKASYAAAINQIMIIFIESFEKAVSYYQNVNVIAQFNRKQHQSFFEEFRELAIEFIPIIVQIVSKITKYLATTDSKLNGPYH